MPRFHRPASARRLRPSRRATASMHDADGSVDSDARRRARRAARRARAATGRARRTLFVADVHLGKAAAFRAGGVPIPRGATAADLARLRARSRARARGASSCSAISCTRPPAACRRSTPRSRAGATRTPRHRDQRWCAAITTRNAGDPPRRWRVDVVAEPHPLRRSCSATSPPARAPGFALCGHVHPGVLLTGPATICAPAVLRARAAAHAVLPAFGRLTGPRARRCRTPANTASRSPVRACSCCASTPHVGGARMLRRTAPTLFPHDIVLSQNCNGRVTVRRLQRAVDKPVDSRWKALGYARNRRCRGLFLLSFCRPYSCASKSACQTPPSPLCFVFTRHFNTRYSRF